MRIAIIVLASLMLAACAQNYGRIDDAKCQGYGAHVGSQAYVQCRAQLDAARTQAPFRNDR